MGGSDWILIEIMKKLTLQRKNVLQMYVSSESRRSLEGRAGRTKVARLLLRQHIWSPEPSIFEGTRIVATRDTIHLPSRWKLQNMASTKSSEPVAAHMVTQQSSSEPVEATKDGGARKPGS